VHYPLPLHLHPAFALPTQPRGSLRRSEAASNEIVSIPLWPHMSDAEVGYVADQIRQFGRDPELPTA